MLFTFILCISSRASVVPLTTDLDWQPCANKTFSCATLKVPLAYDGTDEMINISLIKHSVENSKGYILVNPGGPGGSGIDMVKSSMAQFPYQYDMIGFDPRGIGMSSPIKCDNMNSTIVSPSIALSEACSKEKIKDYMSTWYVAHDMEEIRKALQMPLLNFIGYSYGTFLGTVYSILFPQNIGKVVLDGVVDPLAYTGDVFDMMEIFGKATNIAAKGAAELCDSNPVSKCALSAKGGNGSAYEKINEVLAVEPLSEYSIPFNHLTSPLQNPQEIPMAFKWLSEWKTKGALESNHLQSRDLSKTHPRAGYLGVFASDTSAVSRSYSMEEWSLKANRTTDNVLEAFGMHSFSQSLLPVRTWKLEKPTKRYSFDFPSKFKNPIIVIGTLYDPATPMSSAIKLQGLMNKNYNENAIFVKHEGFGHCSSKDPSACIQGMLKSYFDDGKIPQRNLVCKADVSNWFASNKSL